MDIVEIPIDAITIPAGRRQPDRERCRSELVPSIREVGLLHPITVTKGEDDGHYVLVAGWNRLEAVRLLGWPLIPATIKHFDALHAELAEITENIHRVELPLAELDRARNRYVAIYASIHPESTGKARMIAGGKRGGKRKGESPPDGGQDPATDGQSDREEMSAIEATAKKFGVTPEAIRRSVIRSALAIESRDALDAAGLNSDEITGIAAIRDPIRRKRMVILCSHGLSPTEAGEVLDLPTDEVEGLLVRQQDNPLSGAELATVLNQDPIDRKPLISVLAVGLPYQDAMQEVLGERWTDCEETMSDADWLDKMCGDSPGYRFGNRAAYLEAAALYRKIRSARHQFERAIGWSQIKGNGPAGTNPYYWRLTGLLNVKHPKHWRKCPGNAMLPCFRGQSPAGKCTRCRGAGFVV